MHTLKTIFLTKQSAQGLITAGVLALVVFLLGGCANKQRGHGQTPGFEPLWDKRGVEVAAFHGKQPTGLALSQEGRGVVTRPPGAGRPPTPGLAEQLRSTYDGSQARRSSQASNRADARLSRGSAPGRAPRRSQGHAPSARPPRRTALAAGRRLRRRARASPPGTA